MKSHTYKYKLWNNKLGFTLLELSIVLVIIGLIIGGSLVGRDLIKAAEIRSAISDIERIETSINSFKLKYNCLPGDCATATSYFSGASNGNGNGKIGGFYNIDTTEMWQFWYHLAQANMWSGKFSGTTDNTTCSPAIYRHSIVGVNVPASRMGDTIGYTVVYWGGYTDANDWLSPSGMRTIKNHAILFGTSDHNKCETYAPALTTTDALSMDSKVDDSKPGTGKLMHMAPIIYPNCATTTNPATAIYNIANTGINCGFIIKAGF